MDSIDTRRPGEEGIALIVAVFLILLISALGLGSLQRAGTEDAVAASSRQRISAMYAAEAVLNLVQDQLTAPTNIPNTLPLDAPQIVRNHAGFFVSGRTGTVASSVPQPVLRVGRTTADGSQLNINSANSFSRGVYRVGVVAQDSGGGRAQLQAQFTVPEGSASYR